MDPSLGPLLKETGVQNIWVECHPQYFRKDTCRLSTEIERIVGKLPLFSNRWRLGYPDDDFEGWFGNWTHRPERMRGLWICER